MLHIDTKPNRPPSRSEPSPVATREQLTPKAATFDTSPTGSPWNDQLGSQTLTDAQTSALGRLARLAGVRADEAGPGGPSTAALLERALDRAEVEEPNDHVKLQPPTPSPGLPLMTSPEPVGAAAPTPPLMQPQPGGVMQQPLPPRPDSSPSNASFQPLSQASSPTSPPFTQLGTSSSSASLHQQPQQQPYAAFGYPTPPGFDPHSAQQSPYA